MVSIRKELTADVSAVFSVNEAAFDTQAEATLVDRLRQAPIRKISLVAETDGRIVGHILFTPVMNEHFPGARIAGLAPMAVLPAFQNLGIGSALVRAGIEACRKEGYDGIVVLGHPKYYPRFGFVPASRFGITCEYDVPADVFMAIELKEGALAEFPGLVRYHDLFQDV